MDHLNNPLIERASGYFKQLSAAAKELNSASDELGQAIYAIDSVLQKLNLGVPTWARVAGCDDHENQTYWSRELGYAKVGSRWGIALCTREGDYNDPEYEKCEEWLFNDAPRWLRIEAVAKIPDLLEALIKNTEETTKQIRSKITAANNLAVAITQTAGRSARERK